MPIPGNNLRDNWFMGTAPVEIDSLGELLNRVEGFSKGFKLRDSEGRNLTLRMSDQAGVLIVEADSK